ncbi:MAG: acyl-CoA thioesterase domain-containing protein [Pseudomonadota bacterium]
MHTRTACEIMLNQLIDVVTLQPDGKDRFIGNNMHPEGFRVYGGQVLAQAVTAAVATVTNDRVIHSQHAYFLRPGDVKEPIVFEVERARDGGSFSSRRVTALQRGKAILVSSMSFQQPSSGDDYQGKAPYAPPPEGLPSERQLHIESGQLDESFMITTGEDLDIRVVEPIDWNKLEPRDPVLQAWMKTADRVPEIPGLQHALLAYLSDAFLIDVCLITQGRRFDDSEWQIASLDHALWYHSAFRVDDWLLHVVETERISGGRGLARGSFYNRQGVLVASTVQQGVMRLRDAAN